MPSFDVVSEINMSEVDNAIDQALREITQRFDFKGSNTSVVREKNELTIESADDYKVTASVDVLQTKLVKRGVSLKSIEFHKIETAGGGRARQKATIHEGLDAPDCKEIVKQIKDWKLKVQASIQGDLVRITGKKRDDLQDVIAKLKELDYKRPLSYINFRD